MKYNTTITRELEKILVTRPYLPPLQEYGLYLKEIWRTGWLTNNGILVQKLERALGKFLGVKHVVLVANGTLALQLALQGLGIKKQVITTPFSFVATTNAILWQGCKPVFADINESDFCLNPQAVKRHITPSTQAILPVHVYGYPCDVAAISKIAKKHKLKVIYDGAHAFGATLNGRSLLSFGDVSIVSLHATKLFHTAEGGALVTNNSKLAKILASLRDFGYEGQKPVRPGINAKMSEFHAALGLCNLKAVNALINQRRKIVAFYDQALRTLPLVRPKFKRSLQYNNAYYPIVFPDSQTMQRAKAVLEKQYIFGRRYFYPSLNTLSYCKAKRCPVSESVASRVLCLPLYHSLEPHQVRRIALAVISSFQ